jgi:hydrogenase 3 maturation protease
MDATKTSRNSWKEQLSASLKKSRKTAFVGVGQELRGDDAAGILAVRALEQALAPRRKTSGPDPKEAARIPALFFFEAGPLPEASAGPLRRFGPEMVIFLDAADMGEKPGAARWIEPDEIGGFSGSTHTFPMSGYAQYLASELGCRVAVLGIQPKQMEFDSPVSEEIRRTIEGIASMILTECNPIQ